MAARTLALLPLVGVAAWSGNATLARMSHQVRAPPGGEALDFIPGSMDDTIMETLETGDLVFFQRKLTALQPLAALHTWITRLQLRPRFDHCGWVYVDRLGRKFIVEETLDKVQCRPYSARVLTSEATEISVLTLKLEVGKVGGGSGDFFSLMTMYCSAPRRCRRQPTPSSLRMWAERVEFRCVTPSRR
ncbi:hypothetical protein V7S43_012293 [Phytophthora oleae]|uniref:RxLR effector protein n=1 Tax=Phytophthora oleae TaxID=2107226 RepID=A0ABD3F9C3_9STRA